jgi:hypothetical protein
MIGTFMVLLIALCLQVSGQTGDTTKPAPAPSDDSKWFDMLAAAEGSGGWDSNPKRQPTVFAGVKLGFLGPVTLDLGYDRKQARNGFSTEFSAMLPVFRFPGPRKDESGNYLRIYAEPGGGYRWGGHDGAYGSAKVMIALLSDHRMGLNKPSPFVEFQRRFPMNDPLHRGDIRVTFGLMIVLCQHCGID